MCWTSVDVELDLQVIAATKSAAWLDGMGLRKEDARAQESKG